jgi:hypothetical protein
MGLGMYRDPKKGAIGFQYPAVRRAEMQARYPRWVSPVFSACVGLLRALYLVDTRRSFGFVCLGALEAFSLAFGGLWYLDWIFENLSALLATYYSGNHGPAGKGYSIERAMAHEGRWEEAAQALWEAWAAEPHDPTPLWELCGLGFKYGQRPEVRGAAQELLKREDLDDQSRHWLEDIVERESAD